MSMIKREEEQPSGAVVALVAVTFDGTRSLLMVERGSHGWAVPGGYVDGEGVVLAALRALAEETGMRAVQSATAHPARYLRAPGASDDAPGVTVPVIVRLGHTPPPAVTSRSGTRRAEWIPAATYADMEAYLKARFGGHVFPAHTDMLREFLQEVTR